MDFNKVKLLIPIYVSTVAENVWCSSGLKMLHMQNKNWAKAFQIGWSGGKKGEKMCVE